MNTKTRIIGQPDTQTVLDVQELELDYDWTKRPRSKLLDGPDVSISADELRTMTREQVINRLTGKG